MSNGLPSDWDKRRRKVYERDNYQCQNCGRDAETGSAEVHAHHIVPKSKGGTHQTSNLITVCEDCHSAIHNNQKAPTATSRPEPGELADILSRIQKFFKIAQGGLAVKEPGKIQNSKLEEDRVELIQDLGKFSVNYQAPDRTREQAMEDLIQSMVELLRYPEDTWEKLECGEMSREEVKEYSKELTEDRSRSVSNAVNEVQSLGLDSFF